MTAAGEQQEHAAQGQEALAEAVDELQLARGADALAAQAQLARRRSAELCERATASQRASAELASVVPKVGAAHACHLLREDPDLLEWVAPADRGRALAQCIAPMISLPLGSELPSWAPDRRALGLLVLSGVVVRRTGIQERYGAELLGPGDLVQPWGYRAEDSAIPHLVGWRVLEPVRLAVLSPRVVERLRPFPGLLEAFTARALNRVRSATLMMAFVHHPRTETRVHMLFWHLADRWGRVTPEGTLLPLRLSHATIGELIAARRPSVTVALRALADNGLARRHESGWLLCGPPPGDR